MNKYNYIFLFDNNICGKMKALRREYVRSGFFNRE